MRYSLIIAGGSGTRLWPMSKAKLPKQLIPFIGPETDRRSLLRIADDRLEGLVDRECRYICAAAAHRELILRDLTAMDTKRFLGEPTGRDTLAAVGLGAAVIARRDPRAVIGVFTADHVIEPVDAFQRIVADGFALAESHDNALITFGIAPTHPATGYGYLELGDAAGGHARAVARFKEKPDAPTATSYVEAGPSKYLWNSGMFVWRAATLMDCIRRYEPDTHAGLERIADAWDTPQREATLAQVYPTLKKISVDFAVMEPASRDANVRVLAVPMALSWLDVGSWPAFAATCPRDADGNALAARVVTLDARDNLLASNDPNHLITAIGVEGLVIIHTPEATLVCRADRAEDIKKLHAMVGEKFGKGLL